MVSSLQRAAGSSIKSVDLLRFADEGEPLSDDDEDDDEEEDDDTDDA